MCIHGTSMPVSACGPALPRCTQFSKCGCKLVCGACRSFSLLSLSYPPHPTLPHPSCFALLFATSGLLLLAVLLLLPSLLCFAAAASHVPILSCHHAWAGFRQWTLLHL